MKKIISIATIAALAGLIAVGCSTPEESGKTGETTGTGTTSGTPEANKASGTSADPGKTDEKKEEGGH